MDYLNSLFGQLDSTLGPVSLSSFAVIFAAEMGDKSQLVCMALAARYRAIPVLAGAIIAFIILNSLAVIFGAAIANWIPAIVIAAIVAVLFAIFAVQALRFKEDDEETLPQKSGKHLLLTTLSLILIAEFGDKTQLAIVALSTLHAPIGVWIGATAALMATSALGVWAGRTVLQRFPMHWLHRISGLLFILLALASAYQAYHLYSS